MVCSRISIPPELPEAERQRRADALRRRHFAGLALRRAYVRQRANQ
jgi:hypothetical protein